ncbi:hypothetical protein [uncultured Cedecea sp.]|uniref:hypothetical protein n=1 Tax=uncultured Cedecea sp. TaxID=988762 RepID=UPI00260323BA|nr:hypothetical protein [uncultured Cedecea sp.]
MVYIIPKSKPVISELISGPVKSNKSTKSFQSGFASAFTEVTLQDVQQDFIKLPSQTDFSDKLFDEMVLQNLPGKWFENHNNDRGDAIRSMLGIIYDYIEPEDFSAVDRIFIEFNKSDEKFTKDGKCAKDLGYLFQKYGESALRAHTKEYIQNCRDAWHYHHETHNEKISDDDIFLVQMMACKAVIETQIEALRQEKQGWSDIICSGTFIKDACSSLAKTLKHHNINQVNQRPDGSPLGNISKNSPSLPSVLQQPKTEHSAITIPAGNGYVPVTINNTMNGGNGTVGGNAAGRVPASEIDYGIALLNTPNEELGNEKARLVEKFMDLYWGRAKNGGQDKFANHVDSVVQCEPLPEFSETLLSSQTNHTVGILPQPQLAQVIERLPLPRPQLAQVTESLPLPQPQLAQVIERLPLPRPQLAQVTESLPLPQPQLAQVIERLPLPRPQLVQVIESLPLPQPQLAQVIESLPRPLMAQAASVSATQKMVSVEHNIGQRAGEASTSSILSYNLQSAANQVTKELSGLLTEISASMSSNNIHQKTLSELTAKTFSVPEQRLPPASTEKIGRIKNIARSNNSVPQLVTRFETMNTQHLMDNERATNREPLSLNDERNDISLSRVNINETEFQPLKRAPDTFKYSPVYTTDRTIDPFSRHAANLNELANYLNGQPGDKLNDVISDSNFASGL